MPNRERPFHTLDKTSLTIQGRRIRGWGSSEGIRFETNSEAVSQTVGAGGIVVPYATNDNLVTATVTVMQGSRGAAILGQLFTQQLQQVNVAGVLVEYEFQMRNASTGDEVFDPKAYFIDNPGPNQAQEPAELEWTLGLPNARPQMLYSLNLI